MKIYTTQEFLEKLKRDHCLPVMIADLKRETINNEPVLVLYHHPADGDDFGVILDKQYADQLTQALGPHPLVEEFFRKH